MVTKQRSRPRVLPQIPRIEQYADYLKDKRVIVVGPAGYLEGRGLGPWIDSHDVVVAMNWGDTLPAEDAGSRVDVLYKRLLKLGKADDILLQEYLDTGMKWLVAIDNPANSQHTQYLRTMIGDKLPWFVDNQTRQALTRELGNSALLGPITFRHLLSHDIKSLTITGCDFYMTKYHSKYGGTRYRQYMRRPEGTIGPTHDGPRQLRWLIAQRNADPRIIFDEQLDTLTKSPVIDPRVMEGVAAIIPARYGSSRFPGKPLALINGTPMILHVCKRVSMVVPTVLVATDDRRIYDVVKAAGYSCVMTGEALTGTDRVAQAMLKLRAHIFVNVQGDEPLIDPAAIMAVVEAKRKGRIEVVNAMTLLQEGEAESRDVVKAVIRKDKRLAYCSRAAIPAGREGNTAKWKQLGLYAYGKQELRRFADYGKRSPMEEAEDVEILRFLDLGIPVRMVEVKGSAQSVDQPEHIGIVERLMKGRPA